MTGNMRGQPESSLILSRHDAGAGGRTYRTSRKGPNGMPVALTGFWKNESEFVLAYKEIAGANTFRIGHSFEGENVTVGIHDRTGYHTQSIKWWLTGQCWQTKYIRWELPTMNRL